MKKTVEMTNWMVSRRYGEYNLCGTADKHPKLGRNVFVAYTSMFESCKLEDDILYYETKNTLYKCPLKYMDPHPYDKYDEEYIEKLLESLKEDDLLDNIIGAEVELTKGTKNSELSSKISDLIVKGQEEIKHRREKHEQEAINYLKENGYKNSVYLNVSSIGGGDMLAYNVTVDDKEVSGVSYPYVHTGMFQDSVLYTIGGVLDFRYFPKHDSIETYHWSDNIERAYIRNDMEYTFIFNGEYIAPGEIKEFNKERSREGLFSPDAFNGKSIMFDER